MLDRAWHPAAKPAETTTVPTITPSGKMWLRTRCRTLTGTETCAMMGLCDPVLANLTDSHRRDLAGNAFEATQSIAVICGRWAWLS